MLYRIKITLILLILSMQQIFSQDISDFKDVMFLDKGWTFCMDGSNEWYPASVPGTVHSDLLDNGLIENPFYGKNEEKIKWIEDKDWMYTTSFNIESNLLKKYSNARLVFDGLDTFAEVILNGISIMHTDNMFISWEKEVMDAVKPGKNTITVKFTSPIKAVRDIYEETGINYPADNDRDKIHLSVYARKAPYHYGWDWGIRMVGCGIWRPVKIVFYNKFRIDDAYTRTQELTSEKAKLLTELTIYNESGKTVDDVNVDVYASKDGQMVAKSYNTFKLGKGTNKFSIPIEIIYPQIWQPNGWGIQHLYDMEICITRKGKKIDVKKYRTGIRTIEFVNDEDELGRNFYFKVNGNPMFAKGTNYIPQDIILTNVSMEDYKRLFKDMKEANMNMVRIWGGGTYEDELFYELADQYGILVWQDFMFACSAYPGDQAFLDNIRKEAEYNIKRLRNHPSLALWCGNNEIYEGLKYWGWNRRYDEKTFEKMKNDYNTIFRDILPGSVHEFDSQRSYIHTSPDSANWGRPSTQTYGDIHYWGIWYGNEMFDAMDTLNLRFVSEFGFESFPEMKTIKSFAGEEDMYIDSDVMRHRQKSSIGNELIKDYMQNYYRIPDNFDDFVYIGQLLQGHGISYGIETNRRQRPVCMGSLYWQLNDSWPAISWSAIDYYKNKKALYYRSRDAFSPLLASAYISKDSIDIYAVSDFLEPLENVTMIIEIQDFNGKIFKSIYKDCIIKPNTSQKIFSTDKNDLLGGCRENEVVMIMKFINNGKTIFQGHKYFVVPKYLSLPRPELVKEISTDGNEIVLKLKTDVLAKDVFIEIPSQGADFSDNFFDMMAGESKIIRIKGDNIRKEDIENIRIRTLTDTYKQD